MERQIQYIGARYVTKIYENSTDPSSAEWEQNVDYEPLTMVTYNRGSYLSKKYVPATIGNPADNPAYWVKTGDYNGQIADLQRQINNLDTELTNEINTKIQAEASTRLTADNNLQTAIDNEALARTNADNGLQTAIDNEALARANADTGLTNSIGAEALARQQADGFLQGQIDQIVAPSGEAPSVAEVENARIGANGTTYASLGLAIRTQIEQAVRSSGIHIDTDGEVAEYPSVNNFPNNQIVLVAANKAANIAQSPWTDCAYYVLTTGFAYPQSGAYAGSIQIAMSWNDNTHKDIKIRSNTGSWSDWISVGADEAISQSIHNSGVIVSNATQLANYPDADDYPLNSIILVANTQSANVEHTPFKHCGYLIITTGFIKNAVPYGGEIQIAIPFYASNYNCIKMRTHDGNQFGRWIAYGNNDYYANSSNFIEIINEAIESNNAIVHLAAGTYNLFDETHDETYWKTARPSTRYCGLILKNGIKLIGEGEVVFDADYDGVDEDIMENFSIFNIGGDFEIEGIKAHGQNICYLVHDDVGILVNYITNGKIHDCFFEHKGSIHTFTSGAPTCIGAGCSTDYCRRDIANLYLKTASYPYPISCHTGDNTKGDVYVNNCYLNNGTLNFSKFVGGSMNAFASNNKLNSAIHYDSDAVNLVEWNNITA